MAYLTLRKHYLSFGNSNATQSNYRITQSPRNSKATIQPWVKEIFPQPVALDSHEETELKVHNLSKHVKSGLAMPRL
jgi:hypothetical protein